MSTFIQKGNLKLFTVQERNFSNTVENGFAEEISVCSSNLDHLSVLTHSTLLNSSFATIQNNADRYFKSDIYYDYIKTELNLYSSIYRNESAVVSGTFGLKTTRTSSNQKNRTSYDAVQQDLIDAGYSNIKPIVKPDITFVDDIDSVYAQETGKNSLNNAYGLFSQLVYFDHNGDGKFYVELYRGSQTFTLNLQFADRDNQSVLGTGFESYVMLRAKNPTTGAIQTQDEWYHTDVNSKTYFQKKSCYQTILLPKGNFGSSQFYDTTPRCGDQPAN